MSRNGFDKRSGAPGVSLSRVERCKALALSTLARLVMFGVNQATRLRTLGEHHVVEARRKGPGSVLFALWHGDHFPLLHYGRHSGLCVIVSRSTDGEILARVLHCYGMQTVRGSSSRGAVRAMIDVARIMRDGADGAIAVDGPRGPIHQVKPGIILLAKLTGCPIIPLGVAMSRSVQFRSWDRFRVPLPTARVLMAAETPVWVGSNDSSQRLDEHREALQTTLTSLDARAAATLATESFAKLDQPLGLPETRRLATTERAGRTE